MKRYIESALLAVSPVIVAFDLALTIAGHPHGIIFTLVNVVYVALLPYAQCYGVFGAFSKAEKARWGAYALLSVVLGTPVAYQILAIAVLGSMACAGIMWTSTVLIIFNLALSVMESRS